MTDSERVKFPNSAISFFILFYFIVKIKKGAEAPPTAQRIDTSAQPMIGAIYTR